jgi:hypothetical protein
MEALPQSSANRSSRRTEIFVPSAQGKIPSANNFVTRFGGDLVWFNTY